MQPNYCNFDLSSFKLSKMIIVVLSLSLYWEIFNILQYFNGATCLLKVNHSFCRPDHNLHGICETINILNYCV